MSHPVQIRAMTGSYGLFVARMVPVLIQVTFQADSFPQSRRIIPLAGYPG